MKSFIVITMFLVCISCKKDNDRITTLDGAWVESSQRNDTLSFISSSSIVNLKMGKEVRNGLLLPKINSGLYTYEIKGDSISMRYMILSFYDQRKYSFNIDLNRSRLTIGNFYKDNLARNAPLNFIKIQ